MSGIKRLVNSEADPRSPLTSDTKGMQESFPTSAAPGPKRARIEGTGGALASPRTAAHEEETTTRRTRRAPARFAMEVDGDNEKLQVAMERSKRLADHCGTMSTFTVPAAPVFRPTLEEFSDPCSYIEKIRPLGELYGMCTITPPPGWKPPSTEPAREASSVKYKTRKQGLHTLQEGIPFPDGRFYTYSEYKAMANEFKASQFPHLVSAPDDWTDYPEAKEEFPEVHPETKYSLSGWDKEFPPSNEAKLCHAVEQAYWTIVERGSPSLYVEYGNDQETPEVGSGFPSREIADLTAAGRSVVPCEFDDAAFYARTGWNLNNLPFVRQSVLRHLNEEVDGVNVPWLYLGMLFASFAWHNEDHFMYSINYMHHGEGKTWYGVPGAKATEFEKAMRSVVYDRAKEDKDIIYHLTTVISPAQLAAEGVPVYRLFQQPGDFVITFPQAYHAGFSHGFNMAEACNFALVDWLEFGRKAVEKYRIAASSRALCFSHERLLCNLARNCIDHSKSQCDDISVALRNVIAVERRERESLVKDGVTLSVFLPNPNDPRYECIKCRQICYLSAVVCRCAAGQNKQVTCLRHHRVLCSCAPETRILVYWYKLDDLERLLANVLERSRTAPSHASVAIEA